MVDYKQLADENHTLPRANDELDDLVIDTLLDHPPGQRTCRQLAYYNEPWPNLPEQFRETLRRKAASHAMEDGCLYCLLILILLPGNPLGAAEDHRLYLEGGLRELLGETTEALQEEVRKQSVDAEIHRLIRPETDRDEEPPQGGELDEVLFLGGGPFLGGPARSPDPLPPFSLFHDPKDEASCRAKGLLEDAIKEAGWRVERGGPDLEEQSRRVLAHTGAVGTGMVLVSREGYTLVHAPGVTDERAGEAAQAIVQAVERLLRKETVDAAGIVVEQLTRDDLPPPPG